MSAGQAPSPSKGAPIDLNKLAAALLEALPKTSTLRNQLGTDDLLDLSSMPGGADMFLHVLLHGMTTSIDCDSLPTGKMSTRIQVSLSPGLYNLLQYWSASEQRNTAALAGMALEHGLRDLMARGHVPEVVTEKYQNVSRLRLAAGELLTEVKRCNDPDALGAPVLDDSEEL